jgi:hypothetical protein
MAVKKTDKTEQKGLRGIWNRSKERDYYTCGSMRESFLRGAAYGNIPTGFCAIATISLAVMFPLEQWGELSISDYNQMLDTSIIEGAEHLGVHFADENIYIVHDTKYGNDMWRVYNVEDNYVSPHTYKELTFVDDESEALELVRAALQNNETALEHIENYTYFTPSSYYDITQMTVPYEDEGAIERMAVFTSARLQVGDNLLEEYSQIGAFLEQAEAAMSNQTVTDYGFTISDEIVPHAPENGWEEYLKLTGLTLGFTIAVGMAGGVLGGGAGAAIEGIRRRNRRKEYDDKGWKP